MTSEKDWLDEDCQQFADEYDSYLMNAAGQLMRGVADDDVAKYLVQIETEHMGLGEDTDCFERALRVVVAIRADKKLWRCPD